MNSAHLVTLRGKPAVVLGQIDAIRRHLGDAITANLLGVSRQKLLSYCGRQPISGPTVRAAQLLYTLLFCDPGQRVNLVDLLTSYRYSPESRKPGYKPRPETFGDGAGI